MWMRLLYLVPLLFMTGCGLTQVQKDAIGQFSRATAEFGDSVAAQLADARGTVMDLNTAVLTLDPRRVSNRSKIDGALTPDRISVRIRAAATLTAYAELLQALVEDSQQKELESAAGKFKDSLRRLDPDNRKISDNQLTAVGEWVEAVGGLIVECKKKKAIEKIVPEADAQVQEIADLFAKEFKADGPVSVYVNATGLLAVTAADTVLDNANAGLQDRELAVEANRKGIETQRKTEAIYPRIAAAATQLKGAHSEVVKALKEDKVTLEQLNELSKTVGDIAAKTRLLLEK